MRHRFVWVLSLSVALFVAILLGDARQHIIDVFVAGVAIAGFLTAWKGGWLKRLPRDAVWLWGTTLVSIAASIIWSDSISASISVFIRYVAGFMAFGLVYSVATRGVAEVLESALLVISALTAVVASAFIFVSRPSWLPSMNLLYPSYGHNHAADLLLFVFPVVMFHTKLPRPLRIILLSIISIGLVLSFARGAWIFIVAYCVIVLVRSKSGNKKDLLLSTVIAVMVMLLVVSVVASKLIPRVANNGSSFSRVLDRLSQKGSPVNDPRWEYWTQTFQMIGERPLFGSGAGTFYFNSRRLQPHPGAYSWFAHSFFLQTLAEHGIVGALPILLLFGWVIWHMTRYATSRHSQESSAGRLAVGALLVAGYSFIEFNLSFIVIWTLFWAIAGLVLGIRSVHEKKAASEKLLLFPFVILVVYYTLLTAQNLAFVFFPKRTNIALYLAPFDSVAAQQHLMSDEAHTSGIELITAFYRKDTEMLMVIAETWQRLGRFDKATDAREKIAFVDPLFEENHKKYLDLLIQTGRFEEVARWVAHYPPLFFPARIKKTTLDLSLSPAFLRDYSQYIPRLFDSRWSHEVRYARFFYDAGLWYLSTDPGKTRYLWELSGTLTPTLSYLWVERAALEQHKLNNNEAAIRILTDCLAEPAARTHCEQVLVSRALFPPGQYEQKIHEQ